jgi:hypothetical protein
MPYRSQFTHVGEHGSKRSVSASRSMWARWASVST